MATVINQSINQSLSSYSFLIFFCSTTVNCSFLRLSLTNDSSLVNWSFLLKGQMLRFRGHYVSGIRKAFMCRLKPPLTLNEVAAHQECETTCRLSRLNLRVPRPNNSVDMNEAVAFHCHRSHSRVMSIFLLDCTAEACKLRLRVPSNCTLQVREPSIGSRKPYVNRQPPSSNQEPISKFNICTISSRSRTMKSSLRLVSGIFIVSNTLMMC